MGFFPLISVITTQLDESVTENYKNQQQQQITVKSNFKHFYEEAFLFDLYYSDLELIMAIPDPNLVLDF